MYVDPSDPTRTMEQEVNEATAALKGLLGIGLSSTTPASTENLSPSVIPSPVAGGEDSELDNSRQGFRKRNKKKKGGYDQQQQHHHHYQQHRSPRQSHGGRNNHHQQQQSVKDGSNRPHPPSSASKTNKKNKPKKSKRKDSHNSVKDSSSQNFAWSAFQSSPDASKLPTPVFASPTISDKGLVTLDDAEPFSVLLAASGEQHCGDAPEIENAPRAEDLEDQVIAEAKRQQAQAEAEAEVAAAAAAAAAVIVKDSASNAVVEASNVKVYDVNRDTNATRVIGVHDTNDSKKSKQEEAGTVEAASSSSVVITNSSETQNTSPNAEELQSSSDTAPPVSKTGVNLAELAANPPAPKVEASAAPDSSTSTTTIASNSPGVASTATRNATGQRHVLQQQSHLNRGHHPSQQHGGPYPHPAYAAAAVPPHQYPPPPPPGYVTIQVQVPMVLMPGRQMVVTSPAGYPVRVLVPEGIPPGMVIPVHVPAGPPPVHHHHMMPPSVPSPYGNYYHHPR